MGTRATIIRTGIALCALLCVGTGFAADFLPQPEPPGAVVVARVARCISPFEWENHEQTYTKMVLVIEDVLAGDAPDSVYVLSEQFVRVRDGIAVRNQWQTVGASYLVLPDQWILAGIAPRLQGENPNVSPEFGNSWVLWGDTFVLPWSDSTDDLVCLARPGEFDIRPYGEDARGMESGTEIFERIEQQYYPVDLSFAQARSNLVVELRRRESKWAATPSREIESYQMAVRPPPPMTMDENKVTAIVPQPPGAVVIALVSDVTTPVQIRTNDGPHRYSEIDLEVEEVLAGEAPESLAVYSWRFVTVPGRTAKLHEPYVPSDPDVALLVPGQRILAGIYLHDEASAPQLDERLRRLWYWWSDAYVFRQRSDGEEVLRVANGIGLAWPDDRIGVMPDPVDVVRRSQQYTDLVDRDVDEVRERLMKEYVHRVDERGSR